MNKLKLNIDEMLSFDETGFPKLPSTRQLLDKDVRSLYTRDRSEKKKKYIQECIVVYYMGDPNSPAKLQGKSDAEALKDAIEQAGLPENYRPDSLVCKIIDKYYESNISEAGRVIENIQKGLHNINLSISAMNALLNERLQSGITIDDCKGILDLMNNVNEQSKELPQIMKRLQEARENLMNEEEAEISRGGQRTTSSMNASDYMDN